MRHTAHTATRTRTSPAAGAGTGRRAGSSGRHPSLCRSRFWRDDGRWHGVGAAPDLGYDSHSLAYCLLGATEGDVDLYVMINAWQEPLAFDVQDGAAGEWRVAIDTSRDAPDDIAGADADGPVAAMRHVVQPHSIVVLVRRR